MTKILALYLPQFHEIPENNKWWGKGFTEWNVVRAAKHINKHTKQPRIPTDGYYDLSKVENIRHQAKLAQAYGIDGFVIYSYYSNGKKLLETPARLLLENEDINIEYCFSWANHDWMRTWFSYNKQMLRKQQYASSNEEVAKHFEEYLPFFMDKRYIKIDNKPVLFIYDYDAIPDFEMYKDTWDRLAKENGFNGIFLVQTLGGHHLTWNDSLFNACFDFEPTYTTFSEMKLQHSINRIRRGIKKVIKGKFIANYFNYNSVCNYIEKRNENEKNHYLGLFAEWDNSPRHSHNGTVFTNFSIDRFERLVKTQLQKSIEYNKDIIVIDAWNEWGEGAFLEPDNIYSLKKLEVISRCKKMFE